MSNQRWPDVIPEGRVGWATHKRQVTNLTKNNMKNTLNRFLKRKVKNLTKNNVKKHTESIPQTQGEKPHQEQHEKHTESIPQTQGEKPFTEKNMENTLWIDSVMLFQQKESAQISRGLAQISQQS